MLILDAVVFIHCRSAMHSHEFTNMWNCVMGQYVW